MHSEHGWPVVELDDFYRDGRDPTLPMSSLGLPDWDDPSSWDDGAALHALLRLRQDRQFDVPVYDIGRSRATGARTIRAGEAPVVVAEGIFAGQLIGPLVEQGALPVPGVSGTTRG